MPTAPLVYRNWKAARQNKPSRGAVEYPLYTDSRVVGEVRDRLGPYQFLNTVGYEGDITRASIILRVEDHLAIDSEEWQEAGDEHYHGGQSSDALAALLSLSLGMRVKAGAATRRFKLDGDPRGRPIAYLSREKSKPSLPDNSHVETLPEVKEKHILNDAELLPNYPDLSADQAISLLRAARLYQDAIWIADSEPELSWLMLSRATKEQ